MRLHFCIDDTAVRKFEDLSVTQILREINFGEYRSSKTAVFAILGALNLVDLVNFSLQKVKNAEKPKIKASKCAKWQFLHFKNPQN